MSVRDKSKAMEAMSKDWPMIGDLLGGTTAMRLAGKIHLPRWPNEDEGSYDARLKVSTLFPAFARTIEVLAGKPFSKPVTIGDDVPSRIREWCEDVDLQGRNLHAFLASVGEEALAYGLSGILADSPAAPAQEEGTRERTVAEEQQLGIRPYLIQVHPQNILGYRSERVAGVDRFTQLRLLECVEEEDGEFGEKETEQVRVLYPGRWEIYRESEKAGPDGKKEWILVDHGTTSLSYIPFVPVYGKRVAFMRARPPLAEVAHMNVKHWQSQSDQDTLLHVARVPILAAIGIEDQKWKLTIGASAAVKLPAEADLKYVEHSGAAIEAGSQSLKDLEDQMRQAGAELLVIKPGNVTESQTLADNEQGSCALQRITQDLEDAGDAALQFMADFIKEAQGGHITIYKDFGAATLAEASAELLRQMNALGKLSDESLYEEMQRRGIIRPDIKWTEEKERIGAQAPALDGMTDGDNEDPPADDPGAGNE